MLLGALCVWGLRARGEQRAAQLDRLASHLAELADTRIATARPHETDFETAFLHVLRSLSADERRTLIAGGTLRAESLHGSARAAFLAVPAPEHVARGASGLVLQSVYMREFVFLTWRNPQTGAERGMSFG